MMATILLLEPANTHRADLAVIPPSYRANPQALEGNRPHRLPGRKRGTDMSTRGQVCQRS